MISERVQERLARIREIEAQMSDLAAKLEGILGFESEGKTEVYGVAPAPRKYKKKGGRVCSICNKPGHDVRGCPEGGGLHPDNKAKPKHPWRDRKGKPCCGSMGPRHKKDCSNAGQTGQRTTESGQYEFVDDSADEPDPAPLDKSAASRRPPMTQKQFEDVKEDFAIGSTTPGIARNRGLDPEEVNLAVASHRYGTYIFNRRRVQ